MVNEDRRAPHAFESAYGRINAAGDMAYGPGKQDLIEFSHRRIEMLLAS